jgi:zinc transport system permease protein
MTDMDILSALQYAFVKRAIIAGSFIAIVCSLIGVLLVLRRLSLIGDGLAHVTFGSVAVGLLLRQHPLSVAIPIVIVSSLGILKLMKKAKIYGDAAIGIVSSLGIALGILIASVSGGFNIDLFSFLFGNILSITDTEVYTSIGLSAVVLFLIVFFYNEHLSAAFDEEFARVSGIRTERINMILVMLTGITVVLTMKVVGIMLTSSLLILPAVTALQFSRSFKATMVISSCAAVASVISGIALSFLLNLPTGATIVLINFMFFAGAFSYRSIIQKRFH